VFLGALSVSVTARPERLRPGRDLLARLTGVAALAAPAIQNGRLVDQLRHRANHDGLTGLLNRAGFTQQIDHVLTDARCGEQRAGLLFVDLNDFKAVNDAHGHEAGDELLRQASKRLAMIGRASDVVARLGGDEFAILLTNVDRNAQVRATEQRVRDSFAEPFLLGDVRVSIGASVGGGVWPDDGLNLKELVTFADTAMYRDKGAVRSGSRRRRGRRAAGLLQGV
jgi:diguanylate cyclase (GGDEF)-like protein